MALSATDAAACRAVLQPLVASRQGIANQSRVLLPQVQSFPLFAPPPAGAKGPLARHLRISCQQGRHGDACGNRTGLRLFERAAVCVHASHLHRLHRKGGEGRIGTAAAVSAPLETGPAESSGEVTEHANSFCEQFCEDDFDIHPFVSIGLGGRSDEAVFEATVQKVGSRLQGNRVVLRQLIGRRAERWGHRALEVWQRVRGGGAQRGKHPFMAAVHGFIPAAGPQRPLVLVQAFYGSYSLAQWLLCEDWLPRLESRLSLDPQQAQRRIGDPSMGGARVSRTQRVIKVLLRDVLTGVNYLHQRGLAHNNLTLQTLHLSAADQRLKLCVPGNAVDLPPLTSRSGQRGPHARTKMMAFDIRCVGILMARLVLRELMTPEADAHFRAFLFKGLDPASLREFLLPFLSTPDGPFSSPGLQLLDRDGGVGWHLLSRLLAPQAVDRISAADALRHPFLCGRRWRPELSLSLAAWMLGATAVRITEEYVYNASQRHKMAALIAALEGLQPPDRQQAWSRHAAGQWRFLYHTGRHIGMTLRKSKAPVRIAHVLLSIAHESTPPAEAALPEAWSACARVTATTEFVAVGGEWPLDKSGIAGRLLPSSGHVVCEEAPAGEDEAAGLRLRVGALAMELELDYSGSDPQYPQQVLGEVRRQIPLELFDLAMLHRVTYVDGRLLVLRGTQGSALLFTRTARTSAPAFAAGEGALGLGT